MVFSSPQFLASWVRTHIIREKPTSRRIVCHCERMRDERRIWKNGKTDSKAANEVRDQILTQKKIP